MDLSVVLQNLLTAPILFFALGMMATWLRSDLTIPQPIAKFMSIYLLFAIGFHGGVELAGSGITAHVVTVLAVAAATSFLFPIATFFVLRLRLDAANAAAIAAAYGSISAVTFVTAVSFLDSQQVEYSGYMVAAMALMESPAIIVGVLLARYYDRSDTGEGGSAALDWKQLLREAFLNGAVVVLLGSLAIGALTGAKDWESVKPFAYEPFKGVLCLFLLDMGLLAAKRLKVIVEAGGFLVSFGIIAAIIQGVIGIGIAWLLDLRPGDALLLTILCGSASYIAVPAAARLAIPKANPSLYVPLSLAITFPFNIAIGIPLYMTIIQSLW